MSYDEADPKNKGGLMYSCCCGPALVYQYDGFGLGVIIAMCTSGLYTNNIFGCYGTDGKTKPADEVPSLVCKLCCPG